MKSLLALLFAAAMILSCNDSGSKTDESLNQDVDSASDLPAPATIDTSSLQTDTLKVKRALRK